MQRTPAWYAARKGRLTASNFGMAAGVNKYESRQKGLKRALGEDTFTGNDATRHGVKNEPNAIIDYQIKTGNLVRSFGLKLHPEYDWLGGSPDGLVGTRGLIEVKCPFFDQTPHKEIPVHYYCQVNGLMEIFDRDWCDFVSWTPQNGMKIYRVYRDPALWDFLLGKYTSFYAAMRRGCNTFPRQQTGEKEETLNLIADSQAQMVDMEFWGGDLTTLVGGWDGPFDDPYLSEDSSKEEEDYGASPFWHVCRPPCTSAQPRTSPDRQVHGMPPSPV